MFSQSMHATLLMQLLLGTAELQQHTTHQAVAVTLQPNADALACAWLLAARPTRVACLLGNHVQKGVGV